MAIKTLTLAVKADTKDAKAGLAEIRQGIVDMLSGTAGAGSKIVDGSAKALMGLSSALGVMSIHADLLMGAAKTAMEMAQFAGQYERLSKRVSQETTTTLRAATHGLISDFELMSLAAKSQSGDWKITTEQMAKLGEAAHTVYQRGVMPMAEALELYFEAFRTGRMEKLKSLGISLTQTADLTIVYRDAMNSVLKLFPAMTTESKNVGDAMTKAAVDAANAWNTVKVALGSLTPVLVQLAKESVVVFDVFTLGARHWGDALDKLVFWEFAEETKDMNAEMGSMAAEMNVRAAEIESIRLGRAVAAADAKAFDDAYVAGFIATLAKRDKAQAAGKGVKRTKEEPDEDSEDIQRLRSAGRAYLKRVKLMQKWYDEWNALADAEKRKKDARDAQELNDAEAVLQGVAELRQADFELEKSLFEQREAWAAARDPFRALRNSLIAYDLQLKQVASETMVAFAEAGGKAFSMWASGQEGLKVTFKDTMKEFVRAEAAKMATMALEASAWSLFYLAMGNVGQAAIMAESALAFAMGAAVAGTVAMAGGQTSGESGAKAKADKARNDEGRSSSTSGGGGGPVTNHYYLGYGFTDEKAFMRKIDEMQRRHTMEGTFSTSKGAAKRAA